VGDQGLFWQDSLLGAFMLLPLLPVFIHQDPRHPATLNNKRVAHLAVLFLAIKFGFYASLGRGLASGFALFLLSLQLVSWNVRLPTLKPLFSDPSSHHRPAQEPLTRLFRDFARGLLSRPTPFLQSLPALLVAAYFLTEVGMFTGRAMQIYVLIIVFIVSQAFIVLPFGFKTVTCVSSNTSSAWDMSGAYLAAWSVLPVKRESVLLYTYLHVVIMSLLGYILVLTMISLLTGSWQAHVLVPFFALVPCLAGITTNGAAGDKFWGRISQLALFFLVFAIGLYLAFPQQWYFSGLLLFLALLGGGPALAHLRASRVHYHLRRMET